MRGDFSAAVCASLLAVSSHAPRMRGDRDGREKVALIKRFQSTPLA